MPSATPRRGGLKPRWNSYDRPDFLAALRRHYRAELILVLVQLEQLAPGWWLTIAELADQLGTDRATLNRSLRKLEDMGLLRRSSISNTGGTWIWWVQRDANDAPRPDDEPAWLVRDVKRRETQRIAINARWSWAQRQGIPRGTMQSFLGGHQRLMRGRWEVIASPIDCYRVEVA